MAIGFVHPDGRILVKTPENENEVASITIENNAYIYDPVSLKIPSVKLTGFSENNVSLEMLFGTNYATAEDIAPISYKNKQGSLQTLLNTTDNVRIQKVVAKYWQDNYTGSEGYWLSSQFQICGKESAGFGLFGIAEGAVFSGDGALWSSDKSGGNNLNMELGVRPVVYLDSDVMLYDWGYKDYERRIKTWAFTEKPEE